MRIRSIFAVLSILAVATAAAAQVSVDGTRPPCVQASGQARMVAYGFDHVVSIRNGCDQAMACTVSTSVNPSPTSVRVAPAESHDTVMWRGSPASTFVAHVDCSAAR